MDSIKNVVEHFAHRQRVFEMVKFGRAKDPRLSILQTGNPYQRMLWLYACQGLRDSDGLYQFMRVEQTVRLKWLGMRLAMDICAKHDILQLLRSCDDALCKRAAVCLIRKRRIDIFDEFVTSLNVETNVQKIAGELSLI
jgi:hypothetical protein